jgi:hypothetical protein
MFKHFVTLYTPQVKNQIMHTQKAQRLKNDLLEMGIQPASFAYFLSIYIKTHPSKTKPVLSFLIANQLQAQAELISYHLRPAT